MEASGKTVSARTGCPFSRSAKPAARAKTMPPWRATRIAVPTIRFRARARSITKFKRSAKRESFERFIAPEDEKGTSARGSALPGFIVIVRVVAELPSERKTKKKPWMDPPLTVMDTNKEYLLVCIHLYSWLFVSIRARFHETSAPLQEDPEPAVQPKQWLPTAIGRSLRCSGLRSQRYNGAASLHCMPRC